MLDPSKPKDKAATLRALAPARKHPRSIGTRQFLLRMLTSLFLHRERARKKIVVWQISAEAEGVGECHRPEGVKHFV